jgi:hypothetical protein
MGYYNMESTSMFIKKDRAEGLAMAEIGII